MNSLEKIQNTLQGKQQKNPPVSLLLSLYGGALAGHKLIEHYSNPQSFYRGVQSIVDSFNPDILFTPFVYALEAQIFGATIQFFEKAPPTVKKFGLQKADDFLKLSLDDLLKSPEITYFHESTSLIAQGIGKEKLLVACFLSPLDIPLLAFGIEGWMEIVLFAPEKAQLILEKAKVYFLKRTSLFIEGGAHALGLPSESCAPNIFPKEVITKTLLPHLNDSFQKVKIPIVIHNGGHPLMTTLPLLKDTPNILGYVLDSKDSFQKAREIIGPLPILLGNMEGPKFDSFTPDEIRSNCLNILNDRKDDPHFIMLGCGADIPYHTPKNNITTFFDTVRNYG